MEAGCFDNRRSPADNMHLAQWRVKHLNEHSTSHQLLWCIDSLVLRNLALSHALNRYPLYNDEMLKKYASHSGRNLKQANPT
jgi:hypothetical protein